MRALPAALLGLALCAWDGRARAEADAVLLLGSAGESPVVLAAEQSFENEFASDPATPRLERLDLDRVEARDRPLRLAGRRLAVAFGLKPAQEALSHRPDLPLVILFARKTELDPLLAAPEARITGIYLDQPYHRPLAAAQALARDGAIGLLLGPRSAPWLAGPLEAAGKRLGARLVLRALRPGDSPLRQFEYLLKDCAAVVAQSDADVYSGTTLPSLLLNAYRHRVPVVGSSEAMVTAGALAAVYTDPVLLGRQAAALAKRSVGAAALPAPEHPAQYALAVNYQVARSLGLAQLSEDMLRRSIQRHEAVARSAAP